LITGESGTGKEMFAQSIHNHSNRVQNPFIAVNFAALPDNLIESELFGYEEGAFTGAKKSGKKGLFELAHTGTIFLDEIGHASQSLQTRLLRVLEEREIMRLGDTKVIPVDIRVIVATNRNLYDMVDREQFLADLYYRINVFQIYLPPLRNRKDSLPHLVSLLMKKYGYNKTFSEEAMCDIVSYDWKGNIRELKNMIEYSVQISKSDIIQPEEIPHDIKLRRKKHDDDFTNKYQDLRLKLKTTFDLEHIRLILELLSENKAGLRKFGRHNILTILNEKGIKCSERYLRTIFKYLEHYNLIVTGRTKQGTLLSSAGRNLLDYLVGKPM
jgi:transcriptional regulator with PAS, ATPase and Fis domain